MCMNQIKNSTIEFAIYLEKWQLILYLKTYDCIFCYQYRFLSKKSTEHTL